MKKILLTDPVTVTLRAGDWIWILGLLTSVSNQGEIAVLDNLYRQVQEATE